MEADYIIKYQCVDVVRNKSFKTGDYHEAAAYYEKGWLIFEQHITICKTSAYSSAKHEVIFQWNNNPDFEGVKK